MPDYGLFGAEHVRQYEATGGKVGHDWNGAPVLVLHTTGRRSGQIAHPDVKIQVRDKVLPVRARTGTAEDKKRVWPTMTALWPEYDKYQAGTKRDIPVVLLNPR